MIPLAHYDLWLAAQPEQWYAYIFLSGDGEHAKIGRTMNLVKRQAQLRRTNPGVVLPEFLNPGELPDGRIVYFEPDGFRKEKAWHRTFAEFRVGGEWFLWCNELDDEGCASLYDGIPLCDEARGDCLSFFVDVATMFTAEKSGWNPFDPESHVPTARRRAS